MNKSALRTFLFYGALICVFLFSMHFISAATSANQLSYS